MQTDPATYVFDRRLVLLGLVPILTLVAYNAVLTAIHPTDLVFATATERTTAIAAAEAYRRFIWISAFALFTGAALLVSTGALLTIATETPRKDRTFVLSITAATALGVILLEPATNPTRLYDRMGTGLFQALYGTPFAEGEAAPLGFLSFGLDLIKNLGILALTTLCIALIVSLRTPPAGAGIEARTARLTAAAAEQRQLLRQAAAVFLLSCIAMISWMYWPLPSLADKGMEDAYRTFLTGTAVLYGLSFSLGVAAIYGPSAIILHRRARALASEAAEDNNAESWLETHGLKDTVFEQLRQISAIFAPMLISLLPALADLLK